MADELRSGQALTRVRTNTLGATGSSNWLPLMGRGEQVFAAEVETVTAVSGCTFLVEARQSLQDGTYGATKTIFTGTTVTDFPQVGRLAGNWEVRLTCSVYGSGTFVLALSK